MTEVLGLRNVLKAIILIGSVLFANFMLF